MSSDLRPTTTVLIGHFCLFRPSVWDQPSEETEVKGQTKRQLLCPPVEPLTSRSMDSAAVRHNLCLPSSLISIDLKPPSKPTPTHPLNLSLSPHNPRRKTVLSVVKVEVSCTVVTSQNFVRWLRVGE